MVAINLEGFGGMIPATDDRLLPNANGALAENTWVYKGTLRGIHEPVSVYTCQEPATKKVYRIPIEYFDKDHINDSFWMEFEVADTDVVRSPTIGDSFDRYYWAQSQDIISGAPYYNTRARILNSDPPFLLGVPAPTVAPVVTGITGGSGPNETRAYVYTWQTAYGEESSPSPPVTYSGHANGTWAIEVTAPGSGVTSNRNIQYANIYRTITSSLGTATYYFVAQLPIATLTYSDAIATTVVSVQNILKSTYWTPPPEDLEGLVSMPNGMIAGWRDNEVWFCEPYRPHAWPVSYTVSVEFPIVGCGVIGQTLIACTTGNPYAVSGVNPSQMSLSRLAQFEPCLSRGSIVSTPVGVAYASSNGLAIAQAGYVSVVSRQMIGKDDWQSLLSLPTVRASTLNGGYYCWGSVRGGCFDSEAFDVDAFLQDDFSGAFTGAFIDINDARVAYNRLAFAEQPTDNVMTDHWTGELFLLRDNEVLWVDISDARMQGSYKWRSKIFNMQSRKNLGAMRIWFDIHTGLPTLNPVANLATNQELASDQWGLVRVYADSRLVYVNEIRESGQIMRLPAGFKAQYYQVEVEARVEVSKIEVASTVKELAVV
jgi:hypothetical protein